MPRWRPIRCWTAKPTPRADKHAVTLALDGDATALRLCMDGIAPHRKDSPLTFALPPAETTRDAAKAAGAVLDAVARGDLTPTEGAQIMALVETCRRTLETRNLQVCLALEGENNGT